MSTIPFKAYNNLFCQVPVHVFYAQLTFTLIKQIVFWLDYAERVLCQILTLNDSPGFVLYWTVQNIDRIGLFHG